MKHVLLLFRKDFKRRWKNPVVIVGFLLIPIVFAFIFGSVFGGSEDEILPKISVLAADNDQSILSNLFLGALTQGELKDMLQVQAVTEEEGRRLLDRGKASALLIIPLEFGESLWRGTATELMLIKNPAEQFLPQIVEEIADTGTLILSALFTVFADEIELIRGLIEEESVPDKAVAAISVRMRNRIDGIAKFVFPPVISLKQITPSQPGRKQTQELGVVDQILPAMAILFLLFICNVVFEDVLKKRKAAPFSECRYLLSS